MADTLNEMGITPDKQTKTPKINYRSLPQPSGGGQTSQGGQQNSDQSSDQSQSTRQKSSSRGSKSSLSHTEGSTTFAEGEGRQLTLDDITFIKVIYLFKLLQWY